MADEKQYVWVVELGRRALDGSGSVRRYELVRRTGIGVTVRHNGGTKQIRVSPADRVISYEERHARDAWLRSLASRIFRHTLQANALAILLSREDHGWGEVFKDEPAKRPTEWDRPAKLD